MRSQRFIEAVCLSLLPLALASPAAAQDKEPVYRGRTLGQWVARVKCPETEVGDRAVRAFQKLGPEARNAVPALVNIVVWELEQNERGQKARERASAALKAIGPAAVPALRAALKAADVPEGIDRHNAIRATIGALGEIGPGAKAAIGDLIDILKSPPQTNSIPGLDYLLSHKAADALTRIGPASIPALLKVVKDAPSKDAHALANQAVRDMCKWSQFEMRKLGPETKAAVPALLELLKLREGDWAIVDVLGKIGPEAKVAIPALIDALKNKDKLVRRTAVRVLGELGADAKSVAPGVVADLLKDPDARVQISAADLLGKYGPEAKLAVPGLIDALRDKNAEFRKSAARALGSIGPEAMPAVPVLTTLLKDAEGPVRFAAADALLRLGARRPEAEAVLTSGLRDPRLARYIRFELYHLESARALRPSVVELRKALKDDALREWALDALAVTGALNDREKAEARIKEAKARIKEMDEVYIPNEDLDKFYDDERKYVDGPGLPGKALREIGPGAVPALLDALKEFHHRPDRIVVVLVQIDSGPKTIAALTAFVKAQKINVTEIPVWIACMRGLAEIGPEAKSAVPILLNILKSDTPRELRNEAARTLGEIGGGDNRVVAALTEGVKDPAVNFAAFRGLVLLGPSSVPILLDMFQNKDNWKGDVLGVLQPLARSTTAAEALGELGAAGVPALLECLKEKDVLKRTAVLTTLAQIGPEAKAAVPALLELWQKREVNSFLAAGAALRRIDHAAAKKAGVK